MYRKLESDIGYSKTMLQQRRLWGLRAAAMAVVTDTVGEEKKVFISKSVLAELEDYRVPAPSEFWEKFPTNLRGVFV